MLRRYGGNFIYTLYIGSISSDATEVNDPSGVDKTKIPIDQSDPTFSASLFADQTKLFCF